MQAPQVLTSGLPLSQAAAMGHIVRVGDTAQLVQQLCLRVGGEENLELTEGA